MAVVTGDLPLRARTNSFSTGELVSSERGIFGEEFVNRLLRNTGQQQVLSGGETNEEPSRNHTGINLRTRRSHVRIMQGAPPCAEEILTIMNLAFVDGELD